LVSHIEGRTQAVGVAECGAGEDIWALGGGSNRKLEKTA